MDAVLEKVSRPKRGPRKGINQHSRDSQKKFLQARASGLGRMQSAQQAGVSFKTVCNWESHTFDNGYPYDFPSMEREAVAQQIRQFGKETPSMDFIDFRSSVLGRHTFPHMAQWVEWLETSENDHILILCPPESAKSTTMLDYVVWRIYRDQDVRIGYVSKALPHATKMVSRVKNILEQNVLLHALIGNPVPGPGDPHPWQAGHFTVRQRLWTVGTDEADYTLSAYGSGSQITGSRFDLIIFDDPDDVNVGPADRESIWNVILQSGESRLGTEGRMVVIGNRQGEEDVYRKILEQHSEDPELWSVNVQASILDEPDEEYPNKPTAVIWPEKYGRPKGVKGPIKPIPDEEMDAYVQRAYHFFDLKRRRLGRRFFLIYQNAPLSDAQKDFTREMVDGALDEMVAREKVPPGSVLIGAEDPAPAGGAAVLIYALLPPCPHGIRRRQVVDFEWGINWRQPGCMERIQLYGDRYHPRYWVIDRQGGNKFFTDDPMLRQLVQRQGAFLIDITTGSNKNYGDFAVSSLRNLFISKCDCGPQIILPALASADKELTAALRDQLVQYHPDTTYPHDGPMTLWYAERVINDLQLDRKPVRDGTKNRMAGWTSGTQGWDLRRGAWRLRPEAPPMPPPGTLVESLEKPDTKEIRPR